jgi:hypothetical protein
MDRGMKITPLQCYSHGPPLHNSGALPPAHELYKQPRYLILRIQNMVEDLFGIQVLELKTYHEATFKFI